MNDNILFFFFLEFGYLPTDFHTKSVILLLSVFFYIIDRVVKFETSKEAEAAITLFNGRVQANGTHLEVRYDRVRK